MASNRVNNSITINTPLFFELKECTSLSRLISKLPKNFWQRQVRSRENRRGDRKDAVGGQIRAPKTSPEFRVDF
jgi:hypothetical protein